MLNRSYFPLMLVALLLLAASGCASLAKQLEPPKLKLIAIAPAKGANLAQSFKLTLQVSNPNAVALELVGLSYDIEIEGIDLISGLARDIPSIPAYGEQTITVSAALGLFEAMALATKLITQRDAELEYSLNAKLDTGVPIIGKIPVNHNGTLDLKNLVK